MFLSLHKRINDIQVSRLVGKEHNTEIIDNQNNQCNISWINYAPFFLFYVVMVKYYDKCLWHLPYAKAEHREEQVEMLLYF